MLEIIFSTVANFENFQHEVFTATQMVQVILLGHQIRHLLSYAHFKKFS